MNIALGLSEFNPHHRNQIMTIISGKQRSTVVI